MSAGDAGDARPVATPNAPFLLSPGLRNRSPYKVPRHGAPIDLKLDANEGSTPHGQVAEALTTLTARDLQRYAKATAVEAALATRLGLSQDHILVTAGGDDALDRAFRALLWPGRRLVMPGPTFVMLSQYAALTGADLRPISWLDNTFPTRAVLDAMDATTGVVAIVSPNNPSGAIIDVADFNIIAAAARRLGAVVVLDLAYIEFADTDLTAAALDHDNVVTFRTLSKAWGLAGARVGYAVGPAALIEGIRGAGNPYAVSAPSIAVALAALGSPAAAARMAAYVARVRDERAAIAEALRAAPAVKSVIKSQGNFVFARLRSPAVALWLRDAFAGAGIGIRGFSGTPQLRDAVRITCPGSDSGLARVLRAISGALDPSQWRYCSTTAAVAAARAEGAIPIGVRGDQGDQGDQDLTAAGAARIVDDPADFTEVPP